MKRLPILIAAATMLAVSAFADEDCHLIFLRNPNLPRDCVELAWTLQNSTAAIGCLYDQDGIDALQCANDLLGQAYQRRGERFGNARLVRPMFERATVRLSDRLAKDADTTREELTTLHAEDIELPRENC